jgi:hypothetical protein
MAERRRIMRVPSVKTEGSIKGRTFGKLAMSFRVRIARVSSRSNRHLPPAH